MADLPETILKCWGWSHPDSAPAPPAALYPQTSQTRRQGAAAGFALGWIGLAEAEGCKFKDWFWFGFAARDSITVSAVQVPIFLSISCG